MNNVQPIDHAKYPKCVATESLAEIQPTPVKIARSRVKRCCSLMVYAVALYATQPSAKCVEFSAGFSVIDDGQLKWEKAYFGDQQMRFDFYYPEVVDLRKNMVYQFLGKEHVRESALDRRFVERRVGGPLRDPANPCVQLQGWFSPDDPQEEDSPKILHRSCSSGTAALVNGRQTQGWIVMLSGEAREGDGSVTHFSYKFTAWVDAVLKHCIRTDALVDSGDGNFRSPFESEGKTLPWAAQELRNIKVGPQPPSLFEIPPSVRIDR